MHRRRLLPSAHLRRYSNMVPCLAANTRVLRMRDIKSAIALQTRAANAPPCLVAQTLLQSSKRTFVCSCRMLPRCHAPFKAMAGALRARLFLGFHSSDICGLLRPSETEHRSTAKNHTSSCFDGPAVFLCGLRAHCKSLAIATCPTQLWLLFQVPLIAKRPHLRTFAQKCVAFASLVIRRPRWGGAQKLDFGLSLG